MSSQNRRTVFVLFLAPRVIVYIHRLIRSRERGVFFAFGSILGTFFLRNFSSQLTEIIMRYSAFIVFKDDKERRARWHPSPNRTRCDTKKPGTLCIRASGTKRYDDAVSRASSFFLLAVTSLSLSLCQSAFQFAFTKTHISRTTFVD